MMLNIVIDYTAERGTIRVHPADKDLMDRTALVIDNNQPTIVDDAAKVIDRLLILMPDHDFNAVEDALIWLKRHDHNTLWLSDATRREMEKMK